MIKVAFQQNSTSLIEISVQSFCLFLHDHLSTFLTTFPLTFPYERFVLNEPSILAVCWAASLVLIATEGEGGLALRLGHLAGQMDKGFDERAPVHHRHLPQTYLLVFCPVLRIVGIDSPFVLLVQLVAQHDDGDLWVKINGLPAGIKAHWLLHWNDTWSELS